jgi:hypothetical protein
MNMIATSFCREWPLANLTFAGQHPLSNGCL